VARKRSEPAKPRQLRGEPETFVLEPPPSARPTPAKQWRESVDYFMRMIPLESKTARRQVRRLMFALDHEALEILRIARRLEDPYVSPQHFDRLRIRYGRSEIVKQLGRTFAGEHIALAELRDCLEREFRAAQLPIITKPIPTQSTTIIFRNGP
jgi:hypothetical protein